MTDVTFHFALPLQPLVRRTTSRGIGHYVLQGPTTVKHVVEALGVPHTEIGALRVNRQSVGFDYLLNAGDQVDVHGLDAPVNVLRASCLRPTPLTAIRFMVDENVARLAALLRLLGLDAADAVGADDGIIACQAHEEQRIMLSKDVELLKRKCIQYGHWVRAVMPTDQVVEVIVLFGLTASLRPFTRCMHCNAELVAVAKQAIIHRLEPKTKRYFDVFKCCPRCDRIYWHGSHCDHLRDRLARAGIMI